MIFNQFELAKVTRECQDDLISLLNNLAIEHDPSRFTEDHYIAILNRSIDAKFCSILNNDNIVIGLRQVAQLANDYLDSLTVDKYINYIVLNRDQIKQSWQQKNK